MDLFRNAGSVSKAIDAVDMLVSMPHAIRIETMTRTGVRLDCVYVSPPVVNTLADHGHTEYARGATDGGVS